MNETPAPKYPSILQVVAIVVINLVMVLLTIAIILNLSKRVADLNEKYLLENFVNHKHDGTLIVQDAQIRHLQARVKQLESCTCEPLLTTPNVTQQ